MVSFHLSAVSVLVETIIIPKWIKLYTLYLNICWCPRHSSLIPYHMLITHLYIYIALSLVANQQQQIQETLPLFSHSKYFPTARALPRTFMSLARPVMAWSLRNLKFVLLHGLYLSIRRHPFRVKYPMRRSREKSKLERIKLLCSV
jgi:hypothetical protein